MTYADYPDTAKNNARKALNHKKDNGSSCGTRVGWLRANQIANGEGLSEDTVQRTYSFLSRAETYDQGKYFDEDGNEICGSIMYDAWGGDPMLDWAKKKYEAMEEKYNAHESERRTINFELRARPESRTIEGYAAIFDSETNLGWFTEEIARGAFQGADMTDVVALFNHDPNFPLARTSSGTLNLEVDEKGLKYTFEAPDTTFGEDLLKMIRRGDISQSSFAFTIKEQQWIDRADAPMKRIIREIDTLYDVSPVTYPAYKETSVTARMRQQIENPAPKGVADKDYPRIEADIIELKKSRK